MGRARDIATQVAVEQNLSAEEAVALFARADRLDAGAEIGGIRREALDAMVSGARGRAPAAALAVALKLQEEREAAVAPELEAAREAHRKRLEAGGGEGDDFAEGGSSLEQGEIPAHIVADRVGAMRAAMDGDRAMADRERKISTLRSKQTELRGRAAAEPARFGEELRRVEAELAELGKQQEADIRARRERSRIRTGAGY